MMKESTINHATPEQIEYFHNPKSIPEFGPDRGVPLITRAERLLENLRTPQDVCANMRQLLYLWSSVYRQPYADSHMDTCKAVDFYDFHLRVNWPVLEILERINTKEEKYWKGLKGLLKTKKTKDVKKDDTNIGGWDASFSNLPRMRKVAKNLDKEGGVCEPTGEVAGRRDLLKQLISTDGFPEELARRLKVYVEEVTQVTRLAIQAIENAEENPVHAMQYALKRLIKMPYELQNGRDVWAISREITLYSDDIAELEEYIILSWMQTLPDDLKSAAAEKIVGIYRSFAKGDDNIVARLLSGYSREIFQARYGMQEGIYISNTPLVDLYEFFSKENDVLWSVLLNKPVSGIDNVLRKLIGDGEDESNTDYDRDYIRRNRTLSIEAINKAI